MMFRHSAIVAALMAFAVNGVARAEGGGFMSTSVGVDVGYHPYAQTWAQGHKSDDTYTYTGTSWLAYVTSFDIKKENIAKFIPPTIAVWGDTLTNTYNETDSSGAQAKETITTQGIGLGLIHHESDYGVSFAGIVGLERARIEQTGDTPRSQKYPYGFSSRLGLGWAPIHSWLAVEVRVDWVFKHFPSTRSHDDNLKAMQQQSFVPMLGISYNNK